MNARAITSSVRRRQRRAKRTPWLTESEAAAALAADPRRLTIDQRGALYRRIELHDDSDNDCAALLKLVAFEETDERLRRAPLVGQRSLTHKICYLLLLFEWTWTEPEAWMLTAINAFIPRLSRRQLRRLSARQLVLVQHCIEVAGSNWSATACIALIERVYHACVTLHGVTFRSKWTREAIAALMTRHPDAPLPGTLVATLLGAPDVETRTWAFEVLLPRLIPGQ